MTQKDVDLLFQPRKKVRNIKIVICLKSIKRQLFRVETNSRVLNMIRLVPRIGS